MTEASIPGWDAMLDGLRALPAQMLAKLPEDWRADPQVRQEVGRLMLAALAARAVAELGDDGDHPAFMPWINLTLAAHQPNADTVYRGAVITPGGTYRLRGNKGSLRIASIAEHGAHPSNEGKLGAVKVHGFHDVNALPADSEGNFDVILSPERPEGYDGPWLQLNPGTGFLNLRQVASDWAGERDPVIAIERLDAPATRPRPPASDIERRIERVGETTAKTAGLIVDHPAELRAEGYVNKFKVWDALMQSGGLAGQFYYEAVYELADDEALIIESKVPDEYNYFSLILANQVFETTDWSNNHSSLNDSQIHIDADGMLRVVVANSDPGVANWLDTAGYRTGSIQGRWTDCSSQPIPEIRQVRLDEVIASLPESTARVTPEERDRIVRDRRMAVQHRRLW